jgi:hypothetical protein
LAANGLRFCRARSTRVPAAVVTRSSTIASTTIARPALNAVPTSSVWSALITVLPRPGASIRAAMVTMDSAAIIVWFTPRMIVRFAVGSRTLPNVCARVAPSDSLASTVSPGTLRMP